MSESSTKRSKADKWPREYERVPGLDEVDKNDFVAYNKALHQAVRDRSALQVSVENVEMFFFVSIGL